MRRLLCLATVTIALPAGAVAQPAEKQLVVTITSEQLKGGVVSELAWDGNMLVIQGVFAKPSGELDAQYFVKPAQNIELQQRAGHTPASARYWTMKSRRLSPTVRTPHSATSSSRPSITRGAPRSPPRGARAPARSSRSGACTWSRPAASAPTR